MRRSRVGSRSDHPSGADLVKERREVGAQITHLDGIATRRQIVLGPQQQPCPGGVKPVDPRQVERYALAAGQLNSPSRRSISAAVATSHWPAAAKMNRPASSDRQMLRRRTP